MSSAPLPAAYSLGDRSTQIERLRSGAFDVAVVGGGITGAGVAWDAATRGLRVALVERADFAGGTSSRSSKLIHGGLRYLAQGELRLTREAVGERGRLQRLAPHLVELLPFAFPIFHGVPERLKLTAGLWLYDTFAAGSGAPRHTWLDKPATLALAPGLMERGLRGAFVYRDARTDDARLVVEVLRAAAGGGAALANYVAMQGLLTAKGRAVGIAVEDRLSGAVFEIRADCVVLAAGVWLDKVLPPEPHHGPRVLPAKGVHLVVDPGPFPPDVALYLSTTGDGRLVFVIPWQGKTLIGTTDTAYRGDLAAPRATAEDVTYLLDAVNRAFPQAHLAPGGVISSLAGLRPLIAADTRGSGSTASLSREDRVFETEAGAIAIAGGKLTTFRKMGEKVVDLAARRLAGPRPAGASRTGALPLAGFAAPMPPAAYLQWRAAQLAGVDEARARIRARLIERYGAHYLAVEALIEEDGGLAEPLIAGLPAVKAEALFAIRHEQAATISDVLAQRLRVALLAPDQGRAAATTVAGMFERERGWDAARKEQALRVFEAEISQFGVPQ